MMENLIRKNIKQLSPYSTARDEYEGEIGVFLDANENPFNTGLNRYPDPHQRRLKEVICKIKGVGVENIFLGNGSDEPIDILYRIFCEPRVDSVVTITPSYGMYGVAAKINDVEVISVPLNEKFDINKEAVINAVKPSTKMIMLCSPNNPSGNLLNKREIVSILENFSGVVVVDEAYIDFADDKGFLPLINDYKNLVVLQTLSKAWGFAGVRLGMAFASSEIISVMSQVKYPYNIGVHTQTLLIDLLTNGCEMLKQVEIIKKERSRVILELGKFNFVKQIYPSDSNFILVKFDDANKIYNYLIEKTIIVRDRSKIKGCEGMLRITIGREQENDRLIEILKSLV
ncbi:MAG: histidinol-phosphate transaminase [Rikenellaceae bacterium]